MAESKGIPNGSSGGKISPYALPGPQVEPTAGYWSTGPCQIPRVVRIADLLPITDNKAHSSFFPSYPTEPAIVQEEISELKELADRRD